MAVEGSVKKTVDEINEALSNAIPELMLLLLALQEKNAAPQPQLGAHVAMVAQAAEVLGSVCEDLARREYGEHAAIQREILDSAQDVLCGATALRDASAALGATTTAAAAGQTKDWRGAYGTVMEAVKTIAARCIKVLAIVYGAFFKRAVAVAAAVHDVAAEIDPSKADSDPQAFADRVGAATTRASELSMRLRELADNEETPLAKRELVQAADTLDARADALVASCNAYLADSGNAELRQRLDEDVARFMGSIDDGMRPVLARQQDLQQEQQQQQEATAAAAAATAARNKVQPQPQRAKAVSDSMATTPTTPSSKPKTTTTTTPTTPENLREMVARVVREAEKGSASETVVAARELNAGRMAVARQAAQAAEAAGDAIAVQHVHEAEGALEEAIPQLVAAAKAVLEDPQNAEAQEVLHTRALVADAAITQLSTKPIKQQQQQQQQQQEEQQQQQQQPTRAKKSKFEQREVEVSRPIAMMESAADVQTALEQVRRGTANGDVESVRAAVDDLRALERHVLSDARGMAEATRDVGAKRNAMRDIHDVETMIPRVCSIATTTTTTPTNAEEVAKVVAETRAAVDAVVADTKAASLADVEVARRELSRMEEKLQERDGEGVADTAQALSRAVERTAEELRDESTRAMTAAEATAATGTARDMEATLANVLAAAKKARDEGKGVGEEMTQAARKMRDVLSAAEVVFNNGQRRGPATSRVADPSARTLEQVRRAAASVLRRLDEAAVKQPTDPTMFKTRAEAAAIELERIADEVPITMEERVASEATRLAEESQRIADAACDGAKVEVVEAMARTLENDVPQLVEGARCVAASRTTTAGQKAEIETATRRAEAAAKKQVEIARAAVKEPKLRGESENAARTVRSAMRALGDAVCPRPETKLASSQEAAARGLLELRRAANAKDSNGVERAGRAIAEAGRESVEAANVLARRGGAMSDGAATRLIEAARRLAGCVAELRRSTAEWGHDGEKVDVVKAQREVNQRADELQAALVGVDNAANGPLVALAEKERRQLDQMEGAVVGAHDPQETVRCAREIVATQQRLAELVRATAAAITNEEAKKQRLIRDAAELEEMLPQMVAAAKEALRTAGGEGEGSGGDKDATAAEMCFEMRTRLGDISAAVSAEQGTAQATRSEAVTKARKAVSGLGRAARARDNDGMKERAAEAMKAAEVVQGLSATMTPQQQIAAEALVQLARSATAAAAKGNDAMGAAIAAQRMKAPLERLSESGSAAPGVPHSETEVVAAEIRGVALMARRGGASGKKTDVEALLRASRELAMTLGGLSGAARGAALSGGTSDMSERGRAALALDELLREMESHPATATTKPKTTATTAELDRMFNALDVSSATTAEAPTKRDFAESIAQVATDIEAMMAKHKRDATLPNIPGLDTSPLAEQIKRMAMAARNNQRQQLLVCGRAIAAAVAAFCTELRALAERCKDPVYQDKMLRSIAALKNFSVQLKILGAVKAGSPTDDSDADDQIVSVTQSLGRACAEALSTIEISKKAALLR